MTMKTPEAPGNYIAFFRFVHGDSNRFGQKVWCDILVQANPFAKPQVVEMMAAGPKLEHVVEERSSLLDDSMQLEQEIQMNASPNIALERHGIKFEYVSHEIKDEVQQLEAKLSEEKPAADLFLSQIEEPKKEQHPLMKSEPSADDLERIVYLEKLAKVKDSKMVENMMQLLEMGYSVFEVNLSLL